MIERLHMRGDYCAVWGGATYGKGLCGVHYDQNMITPLGLAGMCDDDIGLKAGDNICHGFAPDGISGQ